MTSVTQKSTIGSLTKKHLPKILLYLFVLVLLVCLSFVVLYPVISAFSVAIRPAEEMFDKTVIWIPRNPTFINFKNALVEIDFFSVLIRTVLVTGICSLFQVVTCSMAAYGLSRFNFKGKNLLFMLVVLTIIVTPQITQIPNFINMRYFDFFGIGKLIGLITGKSVTVSLIDTNYVLILPALFGAGLQSGLYVFVFRQFFMGIPTGLEEAAKIDGCNAAQTFIRIIIPNNIPVFVVVFLLNVVTYWNDTAVTGLYLTSNKSFLLMNSVSNFVSTTIRSSSTYNFGENDVLFSAMAILVIIPPIILYMCCQTKFNEFLDRSGIKG